MNPTDNTENNLENAEATQDLLENDIEISEVNDKEENESEKIGDIEEQVSPPKYKNRTLVVATSIFAVTALSFGVWYSFFNNDISGVWATDVEFQENDGSTHKEVMKLGFGSADRMSFFENEKSYFSDKESTSLSVERINGGLSLLGQYSTSVSEENGNIVKMSFPSYQGIYSYQYELSGNIFTGRQLKMSNEDEVMEFVQSDKSYTAEPDANFKPNTGVVGTWEYDEVIYTFTKDGRFTQDSGDMVIDGVYNFGESDDGSDAIIVKYKYNGNMNEAKFPYLLKGSTMTLTINGYDFDFTKVEE